MTLNDSLWPDIMFFYSDHKQVAPPGRRAGLIMHIEVFEVENTVNLKRYECREAGRLGYSMFGRLSGLGIWVFRH